MGWKCFAIATRRCSVLSKSFVKIAVPCKERKQCLACKTIKLHSNILNSPCAEDAKVMEGHNTYWGLYNITIQQYYTLKVLFVRHMDAEGIKCSISHTLRECSLYDPVR